MVKLTERLTPAEANAAWQLFAPYHYDFGTSRENLADSSQRYLAVNEGGKVVGFAAARSQRAKKMFYCSHKIVVLPEYRTQWMNVADALAALYVKSGYAYYCMAPAKLTEYRQDNSQWRFVRKNGDLLSWQFKGAA